MNLKYFFFLLLYFSFSVTAETVNLDVNPRGPLAGEIFDVTFKIKVKNINKTPRISFKPIGAELIGKKRGGESIRTVIINGRTTITKELSFIFKLVSNKPGNVRISNIKIFVDGRNINLPDKTIKVISERKKRPESGNIFVLATSSKKNIFVGEGIDVKYYLYSNVRMTGYDIEQYPKLNGFIKRFYSPKQKIERVEYNGEIYERTLQYSARLYPEKPGLVKIDPLILKVQYFSSNKRNPYFTFGFSSGRMKTKIIQNKVININVNPIPLKNRPDNFTGLVGDHKFKIFLNKKKFLVNEAIEVKIEIEGKGALENYDAPVIYQHNDLEEFDKKGRIIHLNTILAKKVFDYTFLPRGPFKISPRQIKFYFFDPITKQFKGNNLSIPGLVVGGNATSRPSSSLTKEDGLGKDNSLKSIPKTESKKAGSLIAPIFKNSLIDKIWIPKLNIIILVIIIALIGEFIISDYKNKRTGEGLNKLCLGLEKDGLNYSKLYKIIMHLKTSKDHSHEASLSSVIDKSLLSQKARTYFKNLVEKSEQATFKDKNTAKNFVYKESFFEELKSHCKKRV